jgi:enoyl-CoA hydratase/carnithine racemase
MTQVAEAEGPLVLAEHAGAITTITLNRLRQRNAMNRAARIALVGALDDARERGSAVIVLTAPPPAFCAGIDLKEGAAEVDRAGPPDITTRRADWRNVQDEIRRHPAIVIAAVTGYALGGGMTLVNSADLAFAAEDVELGMPEITFGAYPGMAGPSTQLRAAPKHAAWLVLTGQRITGRSAERWGLVNRALPAEEVLPAALETARMIAKYDPIALEYCKKALQEIPSHISDFTAALEFGEHINGLIRIRRRTRDAAAAPEPAP